MKLLNSSIALLFIILLPDVLLAGMLKGKISDTKGEALPFATVYVQGTSNGTTANADGNYQLTLAPGMHKVLCQFMGFRQEVFNVTIKGDEVVTHNFSLQDQTLEMKTVTVKANAEDPAYAMIRKTIARRSAHLQQIKSLQTGVYLKGVFRNRAMPDQIMGIKVTDESGSKAESAKSMGLDTNGRGVLYLVEQRADYYSQGSKEKTLIRSVRQSGNPQGLGSSRMPTIISFYENNINIFNDVNPRGFVSPISDNALHFYKYKYEGEFREGGYTINKIKVIPKRLYEPLFEGTIYIAEDDWAIHSLDMLLTQRNSLELLDTVHLKQTMVPLRKDTWVIGSQLFYPTIKFLGFDIAGYYLTVYNNQKVNEPVPDSIFEGNVISVYDKEANKRDTSYWTETRPIPLETDESKDYQLRDSTTAKLASPEYKDSMRRRSNNLKPTALIMGGMSYRTKEDRHSFSTNSALSLYDGLVNYNTVEGLNVSPKIYWTNRRKDGNRFNGALATRYGFSNTHFNAIGRVSYQRLNKEWRERQWELGVEGGKYVFQFNPDAILPLYNTISTILYGQNHMKLYERWTGAAFFNRDYGTGFSWGAKASFQRRLPLENTSGFNVRGTKADELSINTPRGLPSYPFWAHNAVLAKAYLAYRPGTKYVQYPDFKQPVESDWPLFRLEYEKGIPDILESKTDFDKWKFSVLGNQPLKLAGTLNYNIAVGGFLNDEYVSLPDLKHLNGNQLIISAPYMQSFQLAHYYGYSNAEKLYGELHLEYYLKGLLTNKIPLLRQARWYIVTGTNTFYAGQNNYYTEAFVGIDNLGYKWFRLLRVDYVRSWNRAGFAAHGVRLGLNFNGMVQLGNSRGAGEDW
ncbi:MAG: carboxypeptidase-like regulatory domain-containing protein [Sphingobacteriales bacterium]|nr:MAG: carboxypeptidase-like regulatory domain-containing protein [Sphingobacteriales bacterium]